MSKRRRKPTARYTAWYGLRMLAASRSRCIPCTNAHASVEAEAAAVLPNCRDNNKSLDETAVDGEPLVEPAVDGELLVEPAVDGELLVEPAVDGELVVEPAVDGELVVEPAVDGELLVEPAVDGELLVEPAVDGELLVKPAVDSPFVAVQPAVDGEFVTTEYSTLLVSQCVSDVEDLDDSLHDPDYSPNTSSSDEETMSEMDSSSSAIVKIKQRVTSIVSSSLIEDSNSIVPNSCCEDETTVSILPDMSQHLKSPIDRELMLNRFLEDRCHQKACNETSLNEDYMKKNDHDYTGSAATTSTDANVLLEEHVAPPSRPADHIVNVESAEAEAVGHVDVVPDKRSDRPSRPCPFCGQFKIRLTRHIKARHKTEESVKHALDGGMQEQRAMFKQHKRTGIMKHNMSVIGSGEGQMQRERAPKRKRNTDGVVCDKCNGLFSRGWFPSHKKQCIGDTCMVPHGVPTSVFYSSLNVPEDFKTEILSKFNQDEVGKLCQSDEMIAMIGSKLYKKIRQRQDKKVAVKKSVMTDMRRLASLFIHFRAVWQKLADAEEPTQATRSSMKTTPEFIDMFHRRNYYILEQACLAYTSRDVDSMLGDKSGLMISVYYLLIDAAKKIRVHHLVREDNASAADAAEFLDVLAFNKHSLIGGAVYNLNKNRQTSLRRTQNLPPEEEVQKMRTYTVDRINSLLQDNYIHWSATEFLELRDLACSRLTLFNARRGGEPARLHLSDWKDACNKVWFSPSAVKGLVDDEKRLVDENSMIMYQTGKGINHLVPVIVPPDTVEAVKKIVSPEERQQVGIPADNPYLFPSMSTSDSHVSGWHAITRVAVKAGVPDKTITATKMRHLTSTLYAALDIPEAQRSAFYRHMGHSKHINENIYQAPIAEVEVRHVGSVLRKFGEFAYGTIM